MDCWIALCCHVSFFFLLFASVAQGADILSQGQSLKEGDTLISQGKVFELGFFTPPGGNTARRYVGIWYYSLPARAVVWVANRNDPLTGPPGGNLSFSGDGNLVIFDGGGRLRWTTANSSAADGRSVLQLMDNGNLFLNTSDGRTVRWESFEHPTDTFLPGMRVIVDRSTREGTLLRSWGSSADPSEGEYSLGLDRELTGQVFTWRGSAPYWRSGPVIGGMFSGVTVRPLGVYGWKIDPDEQGTMALTFSPFNASLFRFVLQWDGSVNSVILDKETKQWSTAVLEPSGECDRYSRCGNNARCAYSDDRSVACECLEGFRPRSEAAWGSGNWSGGCMRRTQLKCEANATLAREMEDDDFSVLRGVKLPDLSRWSVADEGGCRSTCLGNCSCMAYSHGADIGCLTWFTALVDVRLLPTGGNNLYIKLAGSELAHGKSKVWIVGLVVALLVVIIILLSFFLWWKYRAKAKEWWKKRGNAEELPFGTSSGRQVPPDFTNTAEFVHQAKDEEDSESPFSLLCFGRILAATENFSESNKLGEGGFGIVYKGVLPEGKEVAVKRLSQTSGQGLEEFKNEVMLIAKLQHRNLVRLMGCCIQEDEKILIYEYLPNKSLDAFIFDPSMRPLLDWRKRFNIIEGIARGLLYLHRDSRLRIIHRDLKASNILLDEEMNPKISDFGMARIFGGNQNQANTTRLVGTFGYMSPEYAMEGLFSIKSDVYSFGVLTLEIITGQKNSSFRRVENSPNLVGYAWKLWNEDRSLELVDPLIRSSISTWEVMRCIQVGLLCVQDRANERPTMSSVVFMLGNEAMAHPVPKQPTFTLEGSPTETESSQLDCESFASSDVTVSVVSGR